MCLLEIERNGYAIVDKINLESGLKNRLISLGMARNSRICVKHYGCFKSTVQIMINHLLIALRREEDTTKGEIMSEETKTLKKELAKRKRMAVEVASEIHDIVEDTLWTEYDKMPDLSEKLVKLVKEANAFKAENGL